MFGLGVTEVIILVGILVLLFGSRKIADLAQGVGDAVQILRKAFTSDLDDTNNKK